MHINALRTEFPLEFIHHIFGNVNVNSIYQSLKNHPFQIVFVEDVNWSHIFKFQCADSMQGKSRKFSHVLESCL